MSEKNQNKIELLMKRGVRVLAPETVEIGEDVNPDRISPDRVTIYPGCRIYGDETLVMAGATLGFEGPATVVNCQVGPQVELRGGFFQKAVFLEKASLGLGSHIREGCLLEEQSGGAHCVGLKQTVLFPFVILGSLINFCDCLMAGGTSRKNHSEVGSSYIHFNFTPNGDKATPSLIGDVPRGVMLNQPPIFLGGQGGLVGPVRVGFGVVVAAGTILRKDAPEDGKMILGASAPSRTVPHHPGLYGSIRGRTVNNINYIANLIALRRWYRHVRSLFLSGDFFREELLRGAVEKIDLGLKERVHRLVAFAEKLPESARIHAREPGREKPSRCGERKQELYGARHRLEDLFLRGREGEGATKERDTFLEAVERNRRKSGGSYIEVIQKLPEEAAAAGTRWLQGVVDEVTAEALEIIPSFRE
jgi:bifunctional UDP-N-acetylglucosamine pyrophosphorylase / glucosamine-1-phosphate N-acetyltransferase